MSLVDYQTIQYLHFEVTSRCNAACPDCPRTDNDSLPLTTWSVTDFIQAVPAELLRRLDRIGFCGNYGDPITASSLLDICRYVRKHSNCLIRIHTNGSARTTEWWEELARTIAPNGVVVWGLDGLKDTNHIYRVGTNWNTIMRNVSAFNAAGGVSHWQFIPFDHNAHQVNQARALATGIGFAEFIERPHRPITVSPPVRYDWQAEKPPPRDTGPFKVSCSSTERQMIYLTAEGLLFPCCWVGNIYHSNHELSELVHRHGKDSINAKILPIRDIIEGPMWTEIGQWRLLTCNRFCGTMEDRTRLRFERL